MRLLAIDIETTPALADVWGLWNVNVSLNQLRESPGLLCFAAMWLETEYYPESEVMFHSDHVDGYESMVKHAHRLLDAADGVITWNGKRFDIPHLNREFLLAGLRPPSSYQQIDLLETAKRQFKFPSNKLDYVSQALGFEGKVSHEGHGLWVKCMDGDGDAWERMERYNRQDVVLLKYIYKRFQPWIKGHPSYAAMYNEHSCPNCGSSRLQKRGSAYTAQSAFQRYQCLGCGKWSRATRRSHGVSLREVA